MSLRRSRAWKSSIGFAVLAAAAVSAGHRVATALVRALSLEELAKRSRYVVTGEVVELSPYRGSFLKLGEVIFTDVTIRVDRVLRGRTSEKTLTVQVLGGSVGGETEVCPDSPRYEVGEKVLVFLREYNGRLWNTGWYQGKYRLTEDGSGVEGARGLPIAGKVPLAEIEAKVAVVPEPSGARAPSTGEGRP